jgi:uncharacterized integral membrane protein (TIGR00698 family)
MNDMFKDRIPAAIIQALFVCAFVLCFFPAISSAVGLMVGLVLALVFGNPFLWACQKYTSRLLQASVIGLGAGMNLEVVGRVGLEGIGYTAVGIVLAMGIGLLLGRALNTAPNTSMLVCVGTAICGGSAIAAVAPTIRAKSEEVSVALATIFFLNSSALFIFPWIGHALDMSEHAFGLWSALAIHDTSSVVGASMQYGNQAVEVATTVKLARALWIVPVSLAVGWWWNRNNTQPTVKAKRPWFILGFLIAAAFVTWIPALQGPGEIVNFAAKRALVATLFLIGASLTLATIRNVGVKPLIQGVVLWFIVASATIGALQLGWIPS